MKIPKRYTAAVEEQTMRVSILTISALAAVKAFVPSTPSIAIRSSIDSSRKNRVFALQSAITNLEDTVSETSTTSSVLEDFDHHTSDRLPYVPTGYSTWEWKTHHNPQNQERSDDTNDIITSHTINYVEIGDKAKPALLLVHGFGASTYHWRHNIPTLARKYHVYAVDLLGFGLSDKPIMDYDASLWRDQIIEFTQHILKGKEKGSSVAIAGNSLGGYAAMYACSDDRLKDDISGCILLNSAGRFRDPNEPDEKSEPNPIVKSVSAAMQRFVIACSFIYTKQPLRIQQILKQVYPINDANVDSELVESIRTPALDPSAAEVFYRVITKNGNGPQAYVDDILKDLDCPILLAWGESDPWIKSATADKMEMLHAEYHGDSTNERAYMKRVSIDAGHCPHDEAPESVNAAIMEFMDQVLLAV